MKHWKSITALGLTASMVCQAVIPIYADTSKPADYDDQYWERLTDNRLEFDEIEDRVVNFSSDYLSASYSTSKLYAPYQAAVDSLESSIEDSQSALKDAKENGDVEDITYYTIALKSEQGTKKAYESVIKRFTGPSERVLNTTVKGGMVLGAETLMINYYRLAAKAEMDDANVAQAQASYDSLVTQRGLGMATDNDVLTVQDALLTIKVQQQTTRNQLSQLKQNLCMLLGWEYSDDIELGAIPEPDESRVAEMNPETDVEKAIGNNYTLSDLRHTSASGVNAKKNRLEQMEEMEEKIRVGVNTVYSNVLTAQNNYYAASSAYEASRITYEGSGRQYQLGMLSALQYQQLTMAFLADKTVYENAKLDYFEAIQMYDWTIKGNYSFE